MLELRNLSFQVDGTSAKKEIIKNINLTIDDHKFVAITGPNGGGKSTLAKLIMGIEQPTSGQILFNGQDITHMSITERANAGISFAFQQPVRFKGIKVRDLITLWRAMHCLLPVPAITYRKSDSAPEIISIGM